ncbi:MAG TPA: NTP transferase domain-containing protein [Gaiellaceae bacterium]|nr:NTP transferase domain-containing protein [Gaiellaceae bacterium]
MPTVVVPFRGTQGKRRLARLPGAVRAALGEAMLADVVAACRTVGPVYVVTRAKGLAVAATLVADPGGGQGAAVRAGLDAAVAAGEPPPFLVVNADLPCVTPRDLLALAGAVPEGGLALAAADDGTTNALALSAAELFEPLYGPGSARRFEALAPSRSLGAPNLVDDVDTLEDLERLRGRAGASTRRALERLRAGAAA